MIIIRPTCSLAKSSVTSWSGSSSAAWIIVRVILPRWQRPSLPLWLTRGCPITYLVNLNISSLMMSLATNLAHFWWTRTIYLDLILARIRGYVKFHCSLLCYRYVSCGAAMPHVWKLQSPFLRRGMSTMTDYSVCILYCDFNASILSPVSDTSVSQSHYPRLHQQARTQALWACHAGIMFD